MIGGFLSVVSILSTASFIDSFALRTYFYMQFVRIMYIINAYTIRYHPYLMMYR